MTEQKQALEIAHMWLDFKMNSFTQMVPGDPDCDACVLAREYIRARDHIKYLKEVLDKSIGLQGHYAALLNQYDGGKRLVFGDAGQWMKRLNELGAVELPELTTTPL